MDDFLRTSNQQQPHIAKVFTISIKYNIIKLLKYAKSLVKNTILQSSLQVQETDSIMSFTTLYACGRIQQQFGVMKSCQRTVQSNRITLLYSVHTITAKADL